MTYYIKKPCTHCPFRTDVTPFLHPERAEDHILNFSAIKQQNSMKLGYLTLRANEGVRVPEGFVPSDNCYESAYEMIEAYQEEWDNKH